MNHVSIGVVARLWRWLRDFAAMPGRIAKLVEIKGEDADKRLFCKSCSNGRVGNFRQSMQRKVISGVLYESNHTIGTCDSCKLEWEVDSNAEHLLRIV